MAALRAVSALENALRAVADVLRKGDRSWALVGALAVSARTEPRFTRDVDVAVSVSDDPDAEAVVRRFVEHGYSVFLRSASRPQDAADIQALLKVLDGPERSRALDAAHLIVLRGFARGKDLVAETSALLD
mgnify:CR=1 FL=1